MGFFAVIAVLLVQGVQRVKQGHALGGIPGGHLRQDQGGGDGVLIPDVVPQHIAVALLIAHDDLALALALQLVLLLGHELEAGEGVAAGDAVGLGHLPGHLGGDDGLQEIGMLRQLARPAHGPDEVVQHQHAGLVPGDGHKGAVVAADHDAHPVAVRVGAQDEIRPHLVGQVNGQIEALGVLRIGGGHRGEITVQHHLLLDAVQMLHAQAPQGLRHQLPAAAVEGGVHHLEGVGHLGHGLPVVDHGHDMSHKAVVGLPAHDLDQTLGRRVVIGHPAHAGENVDVLQLPGDGGSVLRRQLGAVGPIDLVAVILLGVVAGGDVDARLAAVFPDGEAQLRRGTQRLEDPHMDAVGGADLGGGPGKLHGVVAAVHAQGHAPAPGVLTLGADDVGKALGGPADDMDVHLVQAHLHGAPQTGGAELQRPVEPLADLLFVAADALQLGVLLRRQCRGGQPLLIFLHVVHQKISFPSITPGAAPVPPPAQPPEFPWRPPAGRPEHTGWRRSRKSR